TDSGSSALPLAFRFHVSMCGSLGLGGHLDRWDAAKRAEAARWIALYKDIRHIVQFGDLYRLRSPQAYPFSAVQYMSKNHAEGVLFAFRTHVAPSAQTPLLYVRDLDPHAEYEIEGINGVRLGKTWMQAGLRVKLGNFQSTIRRIRRI